tara:strand:+ start:188 stop:997 length:810 start_codon:yes stop_codon:yes gene_type:complete
MSDSTKVKIVTGWSKPGGSTIAHINLCNLLNDNGIDCTLYGPDVWHLDKCKSDKSENLREENNDIIISHFCRLNSVRVKENKCRHIYSCHETNIAPMNQMNLEEYESIHFVSDFQKKWHSVNHPSVVIPNVVEDLNPSPLGTGVCGIIGSIDIHKQAHVSIQRAMWDGWEKVFLFGLVNDVNYAKQYIEPLLHRYEGKIHYQGHVDDKQKMYDSIDVVYHSSKRETFNYLKAECEKTGVSYRGLDSAEPNAEYLEKEEILELWKNTLKL